MKRFLALLTALACTLSPAIADNPKADAKAVVTSGNARFTVLTPSGVPTDNSKTVRR